MKLSTAKKLVIMSYFMVPGMREILATATRIVYSGDTKRFLFPDGSVLESNKGHWEEMKNPKLEAAVRRFGNGQVLPDRPWPRVGDSSPTKAATNAAQLQMRADLMPEIPTREQVLECEVNALQELCNEKDEQLDKASRQMVVRLDWWAVALVATVLVAHYVFKVL